MAKKMTIEDIAKQEEKIKAEKAKLAKAKKQLIAQENEKIGKVMRKEFGFKDYSEFEQWLAENSPKRVSKNDDEKVEKSEEKATSNPYDYLNFSHNF
ncbi:TPA: hypothetical protein I9085_003058 [Clostridium perfringens]|nr:hypothetical protein [Clostridium perfringens]